MSYYDLDAILTDAQKIPCTFSLTVPHLGYLDNTPSLPLQSGTTLPLPFWLAQMLAISSPSATTSLISLDLPSSLQERVLNALKASPISIDLRAQAPNFYALAARMLNFFEDDELLDVVSEAFRLRANEIGDFAGSLNQGGATGSGGNGGNGAGAGTDGVEFLRGLEEWERALFKSKHESAKAGRKWLNEVKKN